MSVDEPKDWDRKEYEKRGQYLDPNSTWSRVMIAIGCVLVGALSTAVVLIVLGVIK